MNAAKKLRLANLLTALALILAVIQTNLTHPPYSEADVFLWSGIITFATLVCTAFKQYLSPEVSDTGKKITLWILAGAILTGAIDLIPHLHIPDLIGQRIKFWLTVSIAAVNILSKQLFPSDVQKDRIFELKKQ